MPTSELYDTTSWKHSLLLWWIWFRSCQWRRHRWDHNEKENDTTWTNVEVAICIALFETIDIFLKRHDSSRQSRRVLRRRSIHQPKIRSTSYRQLLHKTILFSQNLSSLKMFQFRESKYCIFYMNLLQRIFNFLRWHWREITWYVVLHVYVQRI